MIEFDQVTKTYPDGTTAVRDVTLTVPSRTTSVLLGSSGCGKTTLLRMVNRMVEPSSGAVRIDGADIASRRPVQLRRSIGYVMQHSGLMPHRRVLDNITTVPRLNGVSRSEAQGRARSLMEMVDLSPELGTRYPAQLSGGQQQRVGVARALADDPNILLMDEPFGAVDPLVRLELQVQLKKLQGELRKTIIFVTHDIEEALTLGDQIVVLRAGGEVAQAGTPRELVENPADDFVSRFLGLQEGRRRLQISPRVGGGWTVIDSSGRPIGLIEGAAGAEGRERGPGDF
ncbi:ABC transporter ATP-binding protein [Nesterenkonia suensis]